MFNCRWEAVERLLRVLMVRPAYVANAQSSRCIACDVIARDVMTVIFMSHGTLELSGSNSQLEDGD